MPTEFRNVHRENCVFYSPIIKRCVYEWRKGIGPHQPCESKVLCSHFLYSEPLPDPDKPIKKPEPELVYVL